MSNQTKYVQARPFLFEDDIVSVNEVLRSLHLEEGDYVKAFEQKISEYYSKKYTCVTVNGFSSIHLALIAMDVKKGDEVVIPAYTCPALLYPIKLTGATAVYADIAPGSFNLSVDTIEEVLTKKTKCVIWPHMFGFPAAMDQLFSWKKMVIEDVAQATGGSLNGKKLGALTDICISSFYATKNITAGDGGAVSVNNENYFKTIAEYRYYGGKTKLREGQYYNYKMTNLNAGLGLSQLKNIDRLIGERKQIATWYDERFTQFSAVITNTFHNKDQSCFHRYPLLFPTGKMRDAFKDELKKEGVNCGYGVLEGLHRIKNSGRYRSLKNTDKFLNRILCLPLYPGLSEEDVNTIMKRFHKVFKKID
jgi:dTDP-4-amino-4,6-dideoxygalactose transaminase